MPSPQGGFWASVSQGPVGPPEVTTEAVDSVYGRQCSRVAGACAPDPACLVGLWLHHLLAVGTPLSAWWCLAGRPPAARCPPPTPSHPSGAEAPAVALVPGTQPVQYYLSWLVGWLIKCLPCARHLELGAQALEGNKPQPGITQ